MRRESGGKASVSNNSGTDSGESDERSETVALGLPVEPDGARETAACDSEQNHGEHEREGQTGASDEEQQETKPDDLVRQQEPPPARKAAAAMRRPEAPARSGESSVIDAAEGIGATDLLKVNAAPAATRSRPAATRAVPRTPRAPIRNSSPATAPATAPSVFHP